MKVKIKIKEEEKEIDLKFKGRDQKIFLKKVGEIMKTLNQDNPENVLQESQDMISFVDEMLQKGTGMTIDELDELDAEEKNKLVSAAKSLLLPWGDKGFF